LFGHQLQLGLAYQYKCSTSFCSELGLVHEDVIYFYHSANLGLCLDILPGKGLIVNMAAWVSSILFHMGDIIKGVMSWPKVSSLCF